jgi:hypothetical protein
MADTIAGRLATERKRARPRASTLIPVVLALGAAATVAYGISRDLDGVLLGAPHPPFIAAWDPRAHPAGWAAVALLAAAVLGAPRLLSARASPARFALGAFAGTLVLRLALAALRDGPGAWSRVFDVARSGEAKNEYLAGLPALRYGLGFFLDRFAELVPSLPVHVAGHPPGLMVVIGALGADTPARLAALCIVAGAASAPLTYALGRRLVPERTARVAAVLVGMAPGALQYGATTADALYLTLGLVAACGLASPEWPARAAGAAALAVASFFAWSLLAVGAWAVILLWLRAGPRRALETAALCGLAVGGLYAVLAVVAGFDAPGALRATGDVYRLGVASGRPYAFWVFGSPVAFLLTLGVPIAWLAARALGRGDRLAIAIWSVLAISAVLGFTKAETERIWLFFAPYVCLAAAPLVTRRGLTPLLALLAAQAVVAEALFGTPW